MTKVYHFILLSLDFGCFRSFMSGVSIIVNQRSCCVPKIRETEYTRDKFLQQINTLFPSAEGLSPGRIESFSCFSIFLSPLCLEIRTRRLIISTFFSFLFVGLNISVNCYRDSFRCDCVVISFFFF